MEFCPKSTPLLPFFGQNEIDPLFWPILVEFFIPPGNMFIRTVFLRKNSIFLKKCKNELKNGVLPKKVPLFTFFGQNKIDPFFLADFGQIFYSIRKYVYSNCLSTKQLNFFEKM